MESIPAVADYLHKKANVLAENMVNDIVLKFKAQVSQEEVQQGKEVFADFLRFLGTSLISGEESIHDELLEWSKRNGEAQAAQQEPISVVIDRYPDTRLAFIDELNELAIKFGLSREAIILVNRRLNYMFDISINETILAYERLSERIIRNSQSRIMELSAPVVAIQEGVAVIPLIGLIDEDRVEHLFRNVVPKIADLHIECLIADFSGILVIDELVARHLTNIYRVLGLLGIRVVTSGIRPEIAQAMVNEGISMSSRRSFSTVRQALEAINKQ
ncbi:STAS domain-containing protein [Planococcus lenghuensis]|uniref:Anti-anti-sigma factor n=1 Tax=Planococcus lenghuensis TaxID=2213202 RepID=A0A1Q2KW07_9BACL|nr:STAS domain-containing protein [Planococcus lenghuensis]AQQ51852.1 anti-anti-sigma factor [Planococcus lenghuensis]